MRQGNARTARDGSFSVPDLPAATFDLEANSRDHPTGSMRGVAPGGPPGGIAVELELSGKNADEYGRILRWYAGTLAYRRAWWFCATPAIRRKIAGLVDRERRKGFELPTG